MEMNRNRAKITVGEACLLETLIDLAPFFRDWYFDCKGIDSTDVMIQITEYDSAVKE